MKGLFSSSFIALSGPPIMSFFNFILTIFSLLTSTFSIAYLLVSSEELKSDREISGAIFTIILS